MADYTWRPIEPLSEADRTIDLAAVQPLYEAWRAARQRLEKSSPEGLKRFKERLVRRLSVETGILEQLYDLDRGTTEALVANGFAEDLVSRSSANIETERLIDFLRDHEAGIQLVIDCVAGQRSLTKGVLHELHSILTQHQETTTAVDPLGNRREIALLKGQFKAQPNNPRRPDGQMHEYCPPIHVDSEIDNLLKWLEAGGSEDPVILAAWCHHRFTQIHPYQDGNGRVARALTTLVLLRADLLPLVIDRDLRIPYIGALEQADAGSLGPLATMFAGLEQNAILAALSIDLDSEVAEQRSLTSAVIASLEAKFSKRRAVKDLELRAVNDVAKVIRTRARNLIVAGLNKLKETLASLGEPLPVIHVHDGGPDRDNAHWYRREVVQSGQETGKYVNFEEHHYFTKATMRVAHERLVFVVSLHHVGRELSGVMEATAFATLESFETTEDREPVSEHSFPCSLDPFAFTYKTSVDAVEASFDRWLDMALAVAFKEFGDRL